MIYKLVNIFLLSLFCCQCSIGQVGKQKKSKKQSALSSKRFNIKNRFKIIKIDSLNFFYIIYAKKNDSTIKIISANENQYYCKESEKLKVNCFYEIKIQSYLAGVANKLHISSYEYKGTSIKLEGSGIIWDLFYSENLNGLCFSNKSIRGE